MTMSRRRELHDHCTYIARWALELTSTGYGPDILRGDHPGAGAPSLETHEFLFGYWMVRR